MSEPVQARSRATEERILHATEELLAGRPFEDLAMTDIAKAADMSVGGVYARFESKDALLRALHARYEAYRTQFLEEAFAADLWRGAGLEARVRGVCAAVVTLMRDRKHVLRSFLLRYWGRPDDARGAFSDRLGGLYENAVKLIVERRESIGAPDPEGAVRTALAIVAGSCRDMIVMKPRSIPGAPRISDSELIDALTAAVMAVLKARAGRRRRKP